jgi:uncharacterized membrane protein
MGGNDSMTAKSWLSAGWQTYWKNKAVLALAGLLWFAWDYVLCLYSPLLNPTNRLFCLMVSIVISLPFIIISVGLCFFCLKLSRGLEAPFSTIFEGFRRWWTSLVTGIFILLVLPSIIWAFKYLLAFYALLDRQLSACEALKLSGRITTGHKGQLFYTGLISYGPALVAGIGACTFAAIYPDVFFQSNFSACLRIAAFLAVGCVLDPWAACSFAVAYDRLSKAEEARGELDKT